MQQHQLHMAVTLHRHVQDAATKAAYDSSIAQMQQQKLPMTISLQRSVQGAAAKAESVAGTFMKLTHGSLCSVRCSINRLALG